MAGRSDCGGRAVGRSGGQRRTHRRRRARHTLYQQPDGRNNLVRVTVAGLDAPAARARVIDRRGTPVGTAGLLPSGTGTTFAGEVWVPLSGPSDFQIEVEVGKKRVARTRVRVVPPRRWTLYWLSSNRTDIGSTDLQERCLEIHRANLDAAVARLGAHPAYRWTAECAYQVISYVENRSAPAAEALMQAIRDGKVGFQALFANLLTGLLDHETYARIAWPAGLLARERGLGIRHRSDDRCSGAAAHLPDPARRERGPLPRHQRGRRAGRAAARPGRRGALSPHRASGRTTPSCIGGRVPTAAGCCIGGGIAPAPGCASGSTRGRT